MIKNSVPLKEVLTRRGAEVRRRPIGDTKMLARNDASAPRKRDTADCQLARSGCAAGAFVTRTFDDRRVANAVQPVAAGRKHVARTLSLGFWQEKNFSRRPALRLFVLAKTGLSRESPPPIRQQQFSFRARCIATHGERSVHDGARMNRGGGDDADVTSRDVRCRAWT